jgi:rare lipoprotein A
MKSNFLLKIYLFVILIVGVSSCSPSKIQTKKNSPVNTTITYTPANSTKSNTNKTSFKTSVYKKNAVASYYHDKFNGRSTANGEKFNNNKLTAAHKTLAFGTQVKVTNITNNQYVIVTINDRGPFTKGREIDLTKKAFFEISDSSTHGTLNVDIEILE